MALAPTTVRTAAPAGTPLGVLGVLAVPLGLVLAAVAVSAGVAPTTDTHALPDGAAGRAWVVAGVVVLGCAATWWFDRAHPWRWGTYAGVSAGMAAALTWSGVRQVAPGGGPLGALRDGWLVLGLLAVVGGVLLARRGGRRFGALHPAHADSSVWLSVPVRGGGTLLVEPHRVVLTPADRPLGYVRQAIGLAELGLLQPATVADDGTGGGARWNLPSNHVVVVVPGPALRVVAGQQQWVLAVEDPATLAHVLATRAARSTVTRAPLPDGPWRTLQVRAVALSTGRSFSTATRSRRVQNTPRRWAWAGGTLLAVSLALLPIGVVVARSPDELVNLVKVLPAVAIGVAAVGYGVSLARRLRPAEDNPLPAGAPTWGDPRADQPPVAGWQPWPPLAARGLPGAWTPPAPFL